MKNKTLFLVIFLQILYYSHSYFTINLNHTLKSPLITSNLLLYEQINNDRIITYQSTGAFWLFDNNFNILTGFTARVSISSTENILFTKFFTSQNKLGILSVASNNVTCFFTIFTGGQFTFTSSQPVVYAVSMLNSTDNAKLHSLLISEKSIKLYNSNSYLQQFYNYKPLDPNAKLINCSKVSSFSAREVIIYCFSSSFSLSKWRFSFPLFSQPNLINSSVQFYNHTCKINKILIKENLMFFQDQFLQLTVLDLNQNYQKITFNTNMQKSIFFDAFFYDGFYFILTKAEFIKFKYDSLTLSFIKIEQAQNNLNGTNFTEFSIVFSPYNRALNVGYTKQSLNMHPIYFCPNSDQYNYETKSCSNVPCTVNNCQACKLNQKLCNNCVGLQSIFSNAFQCPNSCNIKNCQVCASQTTCNTCESGYTLDSNLFFCILSNQNNQNNQNKPVNPQQQQTFKDKFEDVKNQYKNLDSSVFQFENILKHTNSLQSIRSQVDFLSPLFALFDDYWYYIYHKNNLNNLQLTPLFFYFIKKVNQQRLLPQMVDMSSIQQKFKINSQILNKFQSFTDQKVLVIDETQTYLVFNLRQFIIQVLLLVILFIAIKYLFILISKVNKNNLKKQTSKFKLFSKSNYSQRDNNNNKGLFHKYFEIIRRIWTIQLLLQTIFQGNLMFGSFQIGLQMKRFFFTLDSKMNLVFLLVIFLSILLFGSVFYFIFRQKNKTYQSLKTTKSLTKAQFKYDNQYLNRSLLKGFKNIAIGFIHSFMLDSNKYQLILIVSIRIIIMLFSFKFKLLYERQSIRIITIIYTLSTIAMDIILLSTSSNFNIIHNQSINLIFQCQLVIILILIITTLLGVIFEVFYTIRQIIFKSNKIAVSKQIIINIEYKNRQLPKKQSNKQIIEFNDFNHQSHIAMNMQNLNIFQYPYNNEQNCIYQNFIYQRKVTSDMLNLNIFRQPCNQERSCIELNFQPNLVNIKNLNNFRQLQKKEKSCIDLNFKRQVNAVKNTQNVNFFRQSFDKEKVSSIQL